MPHLKVIAVIGATGAQGGSVANQFLKDPVLSREWVVRTITRDPSKPSAVELKNKGAEVVAADLDDKASLIKAFQGATAVFAVTNFWEKMDMAGEIQQGKNIVDAAKEAGISHLVWSSLRNVNKLTGGKLPHVYHFDSKSIVEDYARNSGVPSTYFLAGFYIQNLLRNFFRRQPPTNEWVLALPMPETAPIPLFDVTSTGVWLKAIVRKRGQVLGKRVLGATAYVTPKEIIEGFRARYPEYNSARFQRIPDEDFKKGLIDGGFPEFAAQATLETLRLMNGGGYYGLESLEWSLSLLEDHPITWTEYLAKQPGSL
ncbi:NmrA-like family-domain-containing protein [Fusarium oxysporum f. sp. albedinis]|nr:NmrA-like family-domain-containing protein [Fusarium oxysporum f. sp. albedinis]